MTQVLDALIDRYTRAQCEHQDSDHEAPEIDFLAMAEGKLIVRRVARLADAIEQQDLVAGIHQGVDAFRQHRGTAGESRRDELRHGNKTVADKRCENNFV